MMKQGKPCETVSALLTKSRQLRNRAINEMLEMADAIRSLKTEDANPNFGTVKSSQLALSGNWSARANLAELASTDPNRQYELVARAVESAATPELALDAVHKAVVNRKTDFQDSRSVVHISEEAAKRIAEATGFKEPTECAGGRGQG